MAFFLTVDYGVAGTFRAVRVFKFLPVNLHIDAFLFALLPDIPEKLCEGYIAALYEYYPPWEPPVSRLRAIRNGYFPPSEPPQHIVLPCIFDFIRDLLIVISGELQMQYHQIIYKELPV